MEAEGIYIGDLVGAYSGHLKAGAGVCCSQDLKRTDLCPFDMLRSPCHGTQSIERLVHYKAICFRS